MKKRMIIFCFIFVLILLVITLSFIIKKNKSYECPIESSYYCEKDGKCYGKEDDYKLFCEGIEAVGTVCKEGMCIPDCYGTFLGPYDRIADLQRTQICYGQYAFGKRDILACEDIVEKNYYVGDDSFELFKDLFLFKCIEWASVFLNDESICADFESRIGENEKWKQYRNSCYQGIALKREGFSYCDNLIDDTLPSPTMQTSHRFCVENIIDLKIGKGEFRIEMCSKHFADYFTEICIRDNAAEVEDCNKIGEASRGYCLKNVANIKRNKTICEEITNEIIKGHCLRGG